MVVKRFLITPKVDLKSLAQSLLHFEKVFIICSPEKEEAERVKYESVYHLYKDGITLYSGEFIHLANLINKKLYQSHPTAQVYIIPRYTILKKVDHCRIKMAIQTFDKVFIICSPTSEDNYRLLFEGLYKSLDKKSRDMITLYSGEYKVMLDHIKSKMCYPIGLHNLDP